MNSIPMPQATIQLVSWLTAVGIPNTIDDKNSVKAITKDRRKITILFKENCSKPVEVRALGEAQVLGSAHDQHQNVILYKQNKPADVEDMVEYLRRYAKENELRILDFTLDEGCIVGKCMSRNATVFIDTNRFLAHRDSGYTIKDAHDLFNELQVVLGYTPKIPVDRGECASNVRHNGSYGEDTVFRHREFRRSPNPTAEDFARYESVIKNAIRIFMLRWPRLVHTMGMEDADLRQYCLIWVTNFIGLYERPNLSMEENSSLCYKYISQRLCELKNWLEKRGKNSLLTKPGSAHKQIYVNEDGEMFDGDAMGGDLMDTIMDPERYIAYPFVFSDPPDDYQYRARHALYASYTDPNDRRNAASQVLNQLLKGLSHEKYVESLSETALNSCCDIEARQEAIRQLLQHAKNCAACSDYVEVLAVKVHEDMARSDPFSG